MVWWSKTQRKNNSKDSTNMRSFLFRNNVSHGIVILVTIGDPGYFNRVRNLWIIMRNTGHG